MQLAMYVGGFERVALKGSTMPWCKNCILSILHYIPSLAAEGLERLTTTGARIIYDGLFSLQNRAAAPSSSMAFFSCWPEILVHYKYMYFCS